MSELFYRVVRFTGTQVFRVASRPLVLHRERAARPGAWLLAANHESPYDSALLIAATPRVIDWLSIAEIFQTPFAKWFLTAMLALPLDRSRVDALTVRRVARRLRSGRVVGLFPEGGVRRSEDSVLRGGSLKEGIARMADLCQVPVVPCVVVGGSAFHRWQSWLPLFRTRWAVAFGEALFLPSDGDREAAQARLLSEIEKSMRQLHQEILSHPWKHAPNV